MVAEARPSAPSVALYWLATASNAGARDAARNRIEAKGEAVHDAVLERASRLVQVRRRHEMHHGVLNGCDEIA